MVMATSTQQAHSQSRSKEHLRPTYEESNHSVTEAALRSLVDLARAEARLALLETRQIGVRAVVAVCLGLVTGFMLHATVLLAVLVPSVREEFSGTTVVALAVGALCLTVGAGLLTYRSLQTLKRLTGSPPDPSDPRNERPSSRSSREEPT